MADTAAAIMRRIANRSEPDPHPALPTRQASLCAPCAVSWSGEDADCWNCGRPATSTHPTHRSALQKLLAAVGASLTPAPRAAKGAVR